MSELAWYSSKVVRGDQYGRTLGFPTANLDAAVLSHVEKEGVYACRVRLGKQFYRGALYLGPRIVLGETKRVLEIHILDFDQEIYDETLSFQLGPFIRPPMDFKNTDELKAQFSRDVAAVRPDDER
ncbi:MAG: riboflavin kinase [Candidatus Saccharimonadales bacterium]|nr:riboflavin kinase [Candidatus Saccharibacteria bacterium]